MGESTTRVRDLQVRYLEEGRGEPLILLHGASLGSSGDSFARNLRPLASHGIRAIAVDRPGYGGTDSPSARTPAEHVGFVLGFMDALGIERAVVAGHSQQGDTAARLAFEHRDRVPRAVIIGTGGMLPPLPDGRGGREVGERLGGEPTLEQTRELLKANLFNHDLITPDELALRHRFSIGRNFVSHTQRAGGGGGGAGQPAAGDPLWKRIGEDPERFLLLFGRQDKPTTAEQAELAQRMFPQLNLVLYDRCAHLVHWDQEEDFEQRVATFVTAGAPVVR